MSDTFSAFTQTAASALGIGSWYALLRPASFRGASFHVEQSTAASGRRAALHEYPGRDIPYSEDLGRKQWTYTFSAYCIGTLYPMQRDALLKACIAKGPGTLVHPSFGSKQVLCTDCSITEERQSGNYCSFSMSFVEAGQLQEPNSTANTTSAVEGAADKTLTSSGSDFSSKFGVLGDIESTVTGAVKDVGKFLDDTMSLVVSPLTDATNALTSAVGDLGLNASSLVFNAPQLFAKVQGVTGAFGSSLGAAPVVSGMLTMGTLFSSHSVGSLFSSAPTRRGRDATPSTPIMSVGRQREADNAAAFQMLVRQSALVEVALAVPGLPLASTQDGADLRSAITTAFNAAQTDAGNAGLDDSYTALVELENAVIADITQRMLQLPSLTTYRVPRTFNAITLAWRLYQDAERCDELVDRTASINPAFLPRTGRVLSS